MSRIGKLPIAIPNGVTFTQNEGKVTVSGPKGTVEVSLPADVKVAVTNQTAQVTLSDGEEKGNIAGLFRTLLQNAVTGVVSGWEKTLELVGVGYRAAGGDNEVTLHVGFTHPVKVAAPKNVSFKIIENTKIVVSGIDKKVVGEIAAQIRAIKPPEPYKGKGIRYLGEVVRKKAGKVVKAVGAA